MYLAERMASTLEGTEFLPTPLSGLVIVHSISQAVSLLASSAGSEARAGKPWRTTLTAVDFEVSLTPLSPIFLAGWMNCVNSWARARFASGCRLRRRRRICEHQASAWTTPKLVVTRFSRSN